MTRKRKIVIAAATILVLGAIISGINGQNDTNTVPETSATTTSVTPDVAQSDSPKPSPTSGSRSSRLPTDSPSPEATGSSSPRPSVTETANPVQDASPELLSRIADGADNPTDFVPVGGKVVKSDDFKGDVYFVSVVFRDIAGTPHAGVWATTAIEGPATILAVDDEAREATHWPSGPDSAFNVTMMDDGAFRVRSAVSNLLTEQFE